MFDVICYILRVIIPARYYFKTSLSKLYRNVIVNLAKNVVITHKIVKIFSDKHVTDRLQNTDTVHV